ncbi:MAG: hypothetical protein RL354_459, partial [Planctomycetota bacterium]
VESGTVREEVGSASERDAYAARAVDAWRASDVRTRR